MEGTVVNQEVKQEVFFIECHGCGWRLYFRTVSLHRAMVRVKAHHNNPRNRHGNICYDGQYLGPSKARKITDPREIEKAGTIASFD